MWKDYSSSFIKNNQASSVTLMVAALISSLCLSFLCGLFYNSWMYDIEKIIIEEGDWQGRITGDLDEQDLRTILNFAYVENAVVNQELSGEQGTVVDVYFHNARTIYRDMPLMAEQLGLDEGTDSYNVLLLSKYLIHDPQDTLPPLLLTFYLLILLMVSFSMILIIRNAFAVSMNARVHQFGILSSIGATPGQIRTCLMQEAAVLCMVPVMLGSLVGIALCFGIMQMVDVIGGFMPGRYEINFQYHPMIFVFTLLSASSTVLFSAWLPARKLSRLTPLEAIRNAGGLHLKKEKRFPVLTLLFGFEGELAGNSLKLQSKTLRTSTLSLSLSFLGFTIMLCFFALTDLSTKHTYFERYQNAWDVIVTLDDTRLEDFTLTEELRGLEGVRDCVVYQKTAAITPVPDDWQSEELAALGGTGAVAGQAVSREGDSWMVNAPVIILDDEGFLEYCKQIGAAPRLDGTVVLNQIWDSLNSNFRYRTEIPYVKENKQTILLQDAGQMEAAVQIPVLAYTHEVPILREEYDNYALVQFMPLSLWKQISGQIDGVRTDTIIRLLAEENPRPAELDALEDSVSQLIGQDYAMESENRIQNKITNDQVIDTYKLVIGSFCSLLAVIGIANVFSYTLGFLHQRRREIAQYQSVGLTPAGIHKIFCIEALVIAVRPVLITLPLTAAFIVFLTKASHLKMMEVLPEIPVGLIAMFCLAIFMFVALAYYIGGKSLLQCDLSEALRNETTF